MMNLIRNIRYRRQLAEIAYHRDVIADYINLRTELREDFGLVSNQGAIIRCNKKIEHHRDMIEQLKSQIYGGAG